MHTLLVERVLVCRDFVALHVIGVGVAPRAGFRNMNGIDRSPWIGRRADVMYAVAVHANGHLGVALFQLLAVHAGEVFAYLVGPEAWVEPSHVVRVRVATPAEQWNLSFVWRAAETPGRAHGVHRIVIPVTAMAICTTQASFMVDIFREQLCRLAILSWKLGVAGDARVFRRSGPCNAQTTKQDGHANGTTSYQ